MNRNIKQNNFRTADLALTAVLSVSGFVVQEMERVNPARSVFIFESSNELEEKVSGYWRGELLVEPQRYFNELKILKARIYEH